MEKFIEITGTTRAPAYIGNVYYNGLEKIKMSILVTSKKSYAPEVVELSEESAKLVADTIKELAKEVKDNKPAATTVAARKPAVKAPSKAPAVNPAKPAGEIPLV